jgi:hypothetical protein
MQRGQAKAEPRQSANEDKGESEDEFFKAPTSYVKTVVDKALWQQRLALSQEMAREKYKDYDEAIEKFVEAAKNDPTLRTKFSEAALPAEYAYKAGKMYGEVARYGGDLDTMRAKIKEELRAELLAESAKAKAEETKAQPTSLAQERGVNGRFTSSDDESLGAILSRKKR